MSMVSLGRGDEMFQVVVMVAQVCSIHENLLNCPLKRMTFMVCGLYLS